MATAGLILGILGIVLCWIQYIGLILGAVASIFGFYSYITKNKGITGLILGIIAMFFSFVFIYSPDNGTKNVIQNNNANEIVEEVIEESSFKNECINKNFEELARNPEKVKGTNVKVNGEVIQVTDYNNKIELRVNITKEEYGYYTDTIYVTYVPKAGEDKILEDDIVTIWGIAEGDYSYTSIMGSKVTLPKIDAKYIEINK
jgi:hypothetical protein